MRNFAARIIGLIAFAICVHNGSAANPPEVAFQELFKNPAKYDRKRVTIRGIADADGGLLWIYRDVKAWRDLEQCLESRKRDCDDTGTIFVPYDTPPRAERGLYDHVNARWVRVTGILDTRLHGHLGGDPFSIVLDKLEVLPGPRVREFIVILGFFKNDSGRTIRFETKSGDESMMTEGVGPGAVIWAGKIGRGTAFAKTMNGVTFAKGDLIPRRLIDPYYDRGLKLYYFRITDHSIEPVLPRDAVGWVKTRLVDRD
jgi:hypothetical protein